MANAELSTSAGTKTGTFIVNVSIDPSTGIDESDFVLRGLRENGIAGVGFELSDITANRNFNLSFTLPDNKEGSFSVEMTGMVIPEGSSNPEAVMSNTLIIVYDTTANVSMTFGEVDADSYQENGIIVVDVTFMEAVAFLSKTVFQVKKVQDADPALDGIEYAIFRKGESDTAFELVFTVPPNHPSKRFQIEANGDVRKASTGVWDNAVATPITVNYDTRVPELKDYDIQGFYTPGANLFDLVLEYDTRCTLTDPAGHFTDAGPGDTPNYADFFIFEGAEISNDPPNFYRYTGDGEPSYPIPAFPDDNGNADWTNQGLQTEEATFYLLRWRDIAEDPQGNFNITIKPGFVRGPVMPPMS